MTMKQHRVTPRAGILVPLPDSNGYLPEDGKLVVLNSYWYQRQADGDVTVTDLTEDIAAAPAPAAVNATSDGSEKAEVKASSRSKPNLTKDLP